MAADPPDGAGRLPRLVPGRLVLGLERPTFAPIAAVIVLGLAVGERGRRAVELTLGVAFGVTMADLLLSVVGVGAVQAGIFVVLAMAVAVFLGGGDLGVKEAAISAMIIMFTFQPSATGFPVDRFLEALIGGGTALLINALLPVNPSAWSRAPRSRSSPSRPPCSRRWRMPWRTATPGGSRGRT
jgi:uncharacterized membrane protein YgaE (UPF0421/DUF939 family)